MKYLTVAAALAVLHGPYGALIVLGLFVAAFGLMIGACMCASRPRRP
jgi:uncharacterized membrane protein HdeD (DUF308 family)